MDNQVSVSRTNSNSNQAISDASKVRRQETDSSVSGLQLEREVKASLKSQPSRLDQFDSSGHAEIALSVIVPAYNCSSTIAGTISRIIHTLDELSFVFVDGKALQNKIRLASVEKHDMAPSGPVAGRTSLAAASASSRWFEIIVVNDGSKDRTRDAVTTISQSDKRIRLISYSRNMGKGYAIRQGVIHSHGRYVLLIDGDGNISTEVLFPYLTKAKEVDIAIGSKYHPGSTVSAPLSRKIMSRAFQGLVKLMLNLKLQDTQVGLKAGNGEVFRAIFKHTLVRRYAFDVEMLVLARDLNKQVVEMPVKIRIDRRFHAKDIVRMAIDLIAITYRTRLLDNARKWEVPAAPDNSRFRLSELAQCARAIIQ